ncbi:MAG: hypothetical protein Q8N09_09275 [Thermodesulfovibrionia bacterium]|nr:hypothetical protein [Thermodesulfovibrionia bacterium]
MLHFVRNDRSEGLAKTAKILFQQAVTIWTLSIIRKFSAGERINLQFLILLTFKFLLPSSMAYGFSSTAITLSASPASGRHNHKNLYNFLDFSLCSAILQITIVLKWKKINLITKNSL